MLLAASTYSHDVFPAGTTNCSGPVPGGDVIYDSPDDKLPAVPDLLNNGCRNTFPSFDEGSIYPGGVDKNPALIMNLSPHPQSGLKPSRRRLTRRRSSRTACLTRSTARGRTTTQRPSS